MPRAIETTKADPRGAARVPALLHRRQAEKALRERETTRARSALETRHIEPCGQRTSACARRLSVVQQHCRPPLDLSLPPHRPALAQPPPPLHRHAGEDHLLPRKNGREENPLSQPRCPSVTAPSTSVSTVFRFPPTRRPPLFALPALPPLQTIKRAAQGQACNPSACRVMWNNARGADGTATETTASGLFLLLLLGLFLLRGIELLLDRLFVLLKVACSAEATEKKNGEPHGPPQQRHARSHTHTPADSHPPSPHLWTGEPSCP